MGYFKPNFNTNTFQVIQPNTDIYLKYVRQAIPIKK